MIATLFSNLRPMLPHFMAAWRGLPHTTQTALIVLPLVCVAVVWMGRRNG